jgi:Xaa-Pro aminopeptidase
LSEKETKPIVSRPKAYLKARHQAVRAAMKALKLDGILLTHAPDLAYLTNFTSSDAVGLITEKDFRLATDFRYKEQAALEAGWLKLHLREAKMSDLLAKVFAETKVKRVGFEANFTTVGQIDALQIALQGKDGAGAGSPVHVELVPLDNVMVNLRKVKDDHEIDLVRKSIGIAEEAFLAIRDEIKVGQSESYLAGLLEFEMRSRGASGSSFPAIVAAGTSSSLPHYRPTDALVQADQPLLFDWGAVHKGYCSDLTRTFMIGRVNPRMKKIYQVVLEAQQAVIAFLRPGVRTQQADTVGRDIIEKAGFGKEFGHGTGHGIGREIHELPSLRKIGGDDELHPGMIVTVEPGIYLPGEGGVRIEDDVLITHSGCEVLTSLNKTLEGCHIE